MNDVEVVAVSDCAYDLSEMAPGVFFLHTAVGYQVVENLAAAHVLHDEVEFVGSVDDFV